MRPGIRNSGRFFSESAARRQEKASLRRRGQFHPAGAGNCTSGGAQEDRGPVSMTQTTRLHEDGRRALAFIAGNADGYTRAVMLAHGFSLALTASLISAGLATDRMPKRRVGRGTVARVRITDAGRQALGEHEPLPSPSLSFVQARGNLIRILEQALAAAEELGDGTTAYLIERALDEVTKHLDRGGPMKVARLKITEAGRRALRRAEMRDVVPLQSA
jgi:hypothetical protein